MPTAALMTDDTFFSWVDHSDCGKPCDIQKYRYQSKGLRITKESGFLWVGEPKNSVDRFTLSHSEDFPFYSGDTAKDFVRHGHLRSELTSNPANPPIIFDTVEKINDRYYSIFAMQRSDTIRCKRVLAVTTIKGNLVRFQYDLPTTKRSHEAYAFFVFLSRRKASSSSKIWALSWSLSIRPEQMSCLSNTMTRLTFSVSPGSP